MEYSAWADVGWIHLGHEVERPITTEVLGNYETGKQQQTPHWPIAIGAATGHVRAFLFNSSLTLNHTVAVLQWIHSCPATLLFVADKQVIRPFIGQHASDHV